MAIESCKMKTIGKPDEGKLQVRFDVAGYGNGMQLLYSVICSPRHSSTLLIITGESKELLEKEVKPVVRDFLKQRNLQLSEEKTQITHIREGFNFLGVNIRKYGNKLLIKPSDNSVKQIVHKLRQETKRHNGQAQDQLIGAINPIIRGWTNYHRHNVAKQTFRKLGCELWQMTWKWSKRRHPKKQARWIKNRYYHTIGNRNWSFADIRKNEQRKTIWTQLFDPAAVAIKRHIKIRKETNPYDPKWYGYFEERQKRGSINANRPMVIKLYKQQKGLCLICKQGITSETGWNCHHIKAKAQGGKEEISNMVLLHPNCHQQYHAQAGKKKSETRSVRISKYGHTEVRAV